MHCVARDSSDWKIEIASVSKIVEKVWKRQVGIEGCLVSWDDVEKIV